MKLIQLSLHLQKEVLHLLAYAGDVLGKGGILRLFLGLIHHLGLEHQEWILETLELLDLFPDTPQLFHAHTIQDISYVSGDLLHKKSPLLLLHWRSLDGISQGGS